jgi:Flp pilus assembly CpaE family ATPase
VHQLNVEAIGVHGRVGIADLAEELGHGIVEPAEIPHVEHDALLVVLEVRGGDGHRYRHGRHLSLFRFLNRR